MLITPPPLDEHGREKSETEMGITVPRRSAEHTRLYADATREVGSTLGVPVLDLWTIFQREAGWENGNPPIGSKTGDKNAVFTDLMRDGQFC